MEFAWRNYVPHGWERHTLIDLTRVRSLIVLIVYFALALYFGRGRTPGKRMAGTRVVSLTHQHVTLWQALERALGYGASFLELGFGFLQFFINRNRQCVHDRIAETMVVDARKPADASADELEPSAHGRLQEPQAPTVATATRELTETASRPVVDQQSGSRPNQKSPRHTLTGVGPSARPSLGRLGRPP